MPVLTRPDGVRLYHELHGPSRRAAADPARGHGWRHPGLAAEHPRARARAPRHRLRLPRQREQRRAPRPGDDGDVRGRHPRPPGLPRHRSGARLRPILRRDGGAGAGAHEAGARSHADPRLHPRGAAARGAREALRRCRRGSRGESMYAPGFPDRHPGARGGGPPDRGRAAGTSRGWAETMGGDAGLRQLRSPPDACGVPTLVLHGTEDQAIAVENAKLLAERIPGAELVLLEGAGHLYHSEQAAAADAAVLDFVRRHARCLRHPETSSGSRRSAPPRAPRGTSRRRTRSATGSPRRAGPWSTNRAGTGSSPPIEEAEPPARRRADRRRLRPRRRARHGCERPLGLRGLARGHRAGDRRVPRERRWPVRAVRGRRRHRSGPQRPGATASRSSGSRKGPGGEPHGTPASSARAAAPC